MNIRIHPAKNQKDYINLAMNLFMQAAAEELMKKKSEAEQQHSA